MLGFDRANEDKETAVHFLNQVDDADLQALLEDGKKEPEVCKCTAKCQAGAVNTACPVCKNNLTACNGPEPKPQPAEEKPQEEKPSGMGGLVVFFVVVLLGGDAVGLDLTDPARIMVVGLNGAGKTTTSAKLAL